MSNGAWILLVLSVVWLGLWMMGSYLFFRGADSYDTKASGAARPATGLQRGQDVRFEGIIEVEEPVTAPLSKQRVAAAITTVSAVSWYYDTQRKKQNSRMQLAKRLSPASVDIVVGDARIQFPLEHWTPPVSRSADFVQGVDEVPAHFGVSSEQLDAAMDENFIHFRLEEWTLPVGQPVFVMGYLEEHDGRLRISPSHGTKVVELYRGSRADALKDHPGTSRGLRIAGYIFAGLAMAPLLVFGIVRLRRRNVAPPR